MYAFFVANRVAEILSFNYIFKYIYCCLNFVTSLFTMAVACASRFSVLKLEDDDVPETVNKKEPTVQNNKQTNKNKVNAKTGGNESKSKSKKKKKAANEIAEVCDNCLYTMEQKIYWTVQTLHLFIV